MTRIELILSVETKIAELKSEISKPINKSKIFRRAHAQKKIWGVGGDFKYYLQDSWNSEKSYRQLLIDDLLTLENKLKQLTTHTCQLSPYYGAAGVCTIGD